MKKKLKMKIHDSQSKKTKQNKTRKEGKQNPNTADQPQTLKWNKAQTTKVWSSVMYQ